jgi:pimeloyl-ACP methyl ester carboxylesterase
MGYFGLAFLARHPDLLADLACVAGIDSFADVRETWFADDWRVGFLDSPEYPDDLGELASQLVAETGAPAIVMYINDGDYADGVSSSPRGNTCRFYLDEQAFLAHLADYDEEDLAGIQLQRNDAAIDVLIRWAGEAGLAADREQLTTALATRPGPGGDGVNQLVQALGLRASE